MNDDTPRVLPTLIPDVEEPVELLDVVDAALSTEIHEKLRSQGFTVQDVIDGRVSWLDPEEIVEEVWATLCDECEYQRLMRMLPDLLREARSFPFSSS
jgi:hypothetical protein